MSVATVDRDRLSYTHRVCAIGAYDDPVEASTVIAALGALIALAALGLSVRSYRLAARTERRQASALLTVHSHRALPNGTMRVTIANAGAASARHCVVTLTDSDERPAGHSGDGGSHIAPADRETFEIQVELRDATYPLHVDLAWADDPYPGSARRQHRSEYTIGRSEPPSPRHADSDTVRPRGTRIPIAEATGERVRELLGRPSYLSGNPPYNNLTWKEMLRRAPEDVVIGDAREPADFERLPVGQRLRAVSVTTGEVRWFARGPHASMHCAGDPSDDIRTGAITRETQTMLLVQGG